MGAWYSTKGKGTWFDELSKMVPSLMTWKPPTSWVGGTTNWHDGIGKVGKAPNCGSKMTATNFRQMASGWTQESRKDSFINYYQGDHMGQKKVGALDKGCTLA